MPFAEIDKEPGFKLKKGPGPFLAGFDHGDEGYGVVFLQGGREALELADVTAVDEDEQVFVQRLAV